MSKQDYKNYYDVVILPPKEVRDYCVSLSKDLYKEYKTNWPLGVSSFKPHLSLYHIKVKPKKVDVFLEDLEKIVKSQKPGKLKVTNFEVSQGINGLLLTTDKPAWLNKVYLKIIHGTVKYFDFGYGVKKLWPLKFREGSRGKNVQKYGTPMVGRYFNPHFTLTVFKDNKAPDEFLKRATKLKAKKFSFTPDAVYVCQIGRDHTCHKIIKKINFK